MKFADHELGRLFCLFMWPIFFSLEHNSSLEFSVRGHWEVVSSVQLKGLPISVSIQRYFRKVSNSLLF